MSKIATYSLADTPLQLSDRLIGTEAPRTPPSATPLATKNFSLGELLQLFSSEFPAPALQGVLDAGNTATQDINLTGTITSTSIKPTNIVDMLNSQGTPLQILSKGVGGICWINAPSGGNQNLQQVTDVGNETTNPIISYEFITSVNSSTGKGSAVSPNGVVIAKNSNYAATIDADLISTNENFQLPDKSGLGGIFAMTSDLADYLTLVDAESLFYPLSSNPAGYLTQESVLEYPTLGDFPSVGASNTIYIALDTDIGYYWDGSAYAVVSSSTSGISGFGIVDRIAKFTPNGSTIGSSKILENTGGAVAINYSERSILAGNTILTIQRPQSQVDFILGNPSLITPQPNIIWSDNDLNGLEVRSKGILSLKAGASYDEGLQVLTSGKLQITQTPDTGATTDKVLVRDSSGNLKQVDYPTVTGGLEHTIASGTDTYTATVTGVTTYSNGDAYLVNFTNGNTTGCTLNINSLGAKTLYRNNDGALIGGDIISGGEMLCVYNSTLNGFQVIGTAPNTLLAYVTNAEATTITKGQPVYAFGGTGDRMTVKLAYNTSDATSAQTVGIVLSTSIAANQKGLIMVQGLLDGLSILPTATWADGDPVYLGATAGTLTNVKPSAPNHLVYLGVVTTASNGSAGRMYVRVQNGYELGEIHDVAISSPTNNQVLQYESATSLWKNKSLTTVSVAASTDKNYVTDAMLTLLGTISQSGLTAYTGTITWSGTTAPSGTTNFSYNWTKIGNQVTLNISLLYGTAGTLVSSVVMALPSGAPTPIKPTGFSGASNLLYQASGKMSNSVTSTTVVNSHAVLRSNAANNGFEIYIGQTAGTNTLATATVTYFTA